MTFQITRRQMLCALAGAALVPIGKAPAAAKDAIKLRELYNKDLSFSDLAQNLEGEKIAIEGFMAPPLKAESRFFVLTRRPMAVCPFCESESDWPSDIVAVYTDETISVVPFNWPIVVTGNLSLGTYSDPEFGFVSRIRLVNAKYERA